jgi:hypothetical protein
MSAPEPEPRCPRCGTPYSEGQEYCLQCGERLPRRGGLITRLGTGWRKRVGWYPGDWIWPALLALVIAGAAGAASAIWLADRSDASGKTIIQTSPAPSIPTTQSVPEPPTTTTPTTTAQPPPPPPPPPRPNRPLAWPAGRSGWTIVLDSLPAPTGRAQAYSEARRAIRSGLKRVGVLDSSKYSSLHPGYLVVFTGIYSNEVAAQSAILNAHQHGYGAAYARRITP